MGNFAIADASGTLVGLYQHVIRPRSKCLRIFRAFLSLAAAVVLWRRDEYTRRRLGGPTRGFYTPTFAV